MITSSAPPAPSSGRSPARAGRLGLAGALAGALLFGGFIAAPDAHAVGEAGDITGASFEWALNEQHQQGSNFGGCDYFSAGIGNGTPEQYRTQQGNVQIIKRTADGEAQSVTKDSRCTLDASGRNPQRMLLTNGSGERNPATGVTEIRWIGSVTSNSYGGMVPWSMTDPALTVQSDGSGQLTATLGGFSSSQENPGAKEPLTPVPGVTVATLQGVQVTDTGIVATPDFAGRDYFPLVEGGRATQSVITDQVKSIRPGWGSWPESFLDFQYLTGLNSYWHSSGLSSDDKKPGAPIEVSFDPIPAVLAPEIVTAPRGVTVSEGAAAEFSAEVSGSPAPTTQWQRLAPGGEWTDVAGETARTLSLPQTTLADSGHQFRIAATNPAGTQHSAPATLTVQELEDITITTHPQSITMLAGKVLRLSVEVTGSSPNYQWQRSTDGGGTWEDWGGTSAQSELVPTSKLSFSGNQYRVLVSNGVQDLVVSHAATVTLESSPVKITAQHNDAIGYEEGKVIFRANAVGSPEPRWEWQFSPDKGKNWHTYTKDKTSILCVEPLDTRMDGWQFRAVIDNGFSESQITEPSTLTVLPATQTSIAYSPAAVFDPAEGGTLSLSGTGFTVPTKQPPHLRVGVMTREHWEAEGAPKMDGFIVSATAIYGSTLVRDKGTFARTVTIEPGQLKAGTEYVLVGFSGKNEDRSLDVAVPLVLTGEDLTGSAAPKTLTSEQLDAIKTRPFAPKSAEPGAEITLHGLDANSWVHTTVYSEPSPLGWVRTDASGGATVSLPKELPVGDHRLVVQTPAGDVRGAQTIAVALPDPGETGDTDGETDGTGGETDGTGGETDGTGGDIPDTGGEKTDNTDNTEGDKPGEAGTSGAGANSSDESSAPSGPAQLSTTGADSALIIALSGAFLLLAGSAALLIARRSRQI